VPIYTSAVSNSDESEIPLRDQLGHVLRPHSLLKTLASQIPVASAGVEILNQLEGQRMDKRLTSLEAAMLSKLRQLDLVASPIPTVQAPPPQTSPNQSNSWPLAVSEYLFRNVEFAIVHTPPEEPDHEFVLPVGNGCLIGNDYVLTCNEVLDLARKVAQHKHGRIVILFGMVWYEFKSEPVDDATGLVLCRLTGRNEETWQRAHELFGKAPLGSQAMSPTQVEANWTICPVMGQEVGFILPSDSDDNMRLAEFTRVEFGTSVISHLKLPKDFRLKAFVTAVFSGRIKQLGAAVFSRDATLLGIISGVEKYEFDVGRRAVVTTLLGFPRFTTTRQLSSTPAQK
jgi:hypothetical protein